MATEALDRLQPTAASHDRVMILEVMGRDAGHIALNAGVAGGADVILIPEIPYSVDGIAAKIQKLKDVGHNFALVVVAEAVKTEEGEPIKISYGEGRSSYGGISHYLAERIAKKPVQMCALRFLAMSNEGGATHGSGPDLGQCLWNPMR